MLLVGSTVLLVAHFVVSLAWFPSSGVDKPPIALHQLAALAPLEAVLISAVAGHSLVMRLVLAAAHVSHPATNTDTSLHVVSTAVE